MIKFKIQLKQLFRKVHPDLRSSEEFTKQIEKLLNKIIEKLNKHDKIINLNYVRSFFENLFKKCGNLQKLVESSGKDYSEKRSNWSGKQAPLVSKMEAIQKLLSQKKEGCATKQAVLYLLGVLEYIVFEISEVTGNITMKKNKKTMTVQFFELALDNDKELRKLYKRI